MAKTCGIHIDQRRFHFLILEGSAKKHRVGAYDSGEIPPGEDPVEVVAGALRDFVKTNKVKADGVGLAVDSGLAAFRELTLPFDDRAKIEDVLKFEIENDLPQWDIDEVAVDFVVLDSKPGVESRLLVTALPKMRLERQLKALEKGGLEATEAELDGSALFNAASDAGLFSEDSAQILVHVGDSSTTVVGVDGGRLSSMRAIRAGALPHLQAAFEAPEDDGEAEAEAEIDYAELERRREETTRRIRRELGRTVSASRSEFPIEAIYVCGHELPGLVGDTLFDVPVILLEPAEEVLRDESALTVAYGAALREMGGGILRPHLRREELRFTGKFERLELPLAVFALLLFTLLAVQLIVIEKQILWRDEGNIAKNMPGDMQHWLEASNAYLLPDPETGYPGRLKTPPETIANYARDAQAGKKESITKFGEILAIERYLDAEIKKLENELGFRTEVKEPQSALLGMTLVMDLLSAMGDRVGRFSFRSVTSDFVAGNSRNPDKVEVKLDMDFFAENDVEASKHYNAFQAALRDQRWCLEIEKTQTEPFPNGKGVSANGILIQVDAQEANSLSGQPSADGVDEGGDPTGDGETTVNTEGGQ